MSEPSNETSKPKTWTRRLGSLFRWLHTYVSLLGFLALLFFAVTGFTLNHADWFYSGEAAIREMQGRIDPALLNLGASEAPRPPERYAEPSPSDDPGAAEPPEESAAPPPFEEMAAPPPLLDSGVLPAPEELSAPPPLGEMESFGGPVLAVDDAGAVDKLAVAEALRSRHGLKGSVGEFVVDPFQCIVSFQGPGYTATAFIDRTTGEYNLTEVRQGVVAVLNELHRGRVTGPAWSWVIDVSAVIMTVASITGLALLFFYRRRRFSGLLTAVVGSVVVLLIYLFCIP